jgi:thiosulfate reductase cytochrome b subunit
MVRAVTASASPTIPASGREPAARPALQSPPVRVVRKHHALVRLTHWAHVPLLLGLAASGLSIYWAAPVFVHPFDPATGTRDGLGTLSVALARLFHDTSGDPRRWIYDHFSLGTGMLATALRLHWALAYLYMLTGALYVLGLAAGGGWRALLPRPSDPAEALAMIRFYLGVVPSALLRRPWPHPPVAGKYNALQRGAYFAMPLLGLLVVASGWAMHKPAQLGWLERLFGSYDGARVVHFLCMFVLVGFLVPHVILVASDGFDTFRSMVTGWSKRVKGTGHGHA